MKPPPFCANCGQRIADHRCEHLIPCCPGSCSLIPTPRRMVTLQGTEHFENLGHRCLPSNPILGCRPVEDQP